MVCECVNRISMRVSKNGSVVAEINWLRNPFGLCNFLQDNIELPEEVKSPLLKKASEYATDRYKAEETGLLYFVCNRWCYDESKGVDRQLFLDVVREYADRAQNLTSDDARYYFNLGTYRQFVEPNLRCLKTEAGYFDTIRIVGEKYDSAGRLGIPVEQFRNDGAFHLGHEEKLPRLKEWAKQLASLAEALQDPETTYYADN